MATPVEVPKLGNTVEECIVARWVKHTGDTVSAGDVVAEIETDKATFEVTAPVDGAILATFFDEGALVPVYTNLFVVGSPGENADSFHPGSAPLVNQSPTPPPAPETSPVGQAGSLPGTAAPPFSPRARRFADEHNFHPPTIAGSGPSGRVLEEDVRREYHSNPRLSSAAKKQPNLEPPKEGSGAGGMTLSSDLAPAATRIPSIREKIARRMRESLASTAQYTLNASADATGLLTHRARIKASNGVVNINDLVVYCTIQALLELPDLNATYLDGKIHKHADVHIGFACDTPRGLMVPVVRDANKLAITDLAVKMKELTAQAVQGTISPDNLSGATFTISNLGNLGIESFTPLLNPPQVAILGIGAIQVKPVRKQGKLEFIDAIGLSLTCDHQIIDGAPGARFLQIVKEKIENVELLCTI
jgi:pyruvate dehydrogenase E2 component (dihydrolipoamide acetyltransferase)